MCSIDDCITAFNPTTKEGCLRVTALITIIALVALVVTSILLCTGDIPLYNPYLGTPYSIGYCRSIGIPVSIVAGLLLAAAATYGAHRAELCDRCCDCS